jgi:ADP-heptose:LPS heptosyltransferase
MPIYPWKIAKVSTIRWLSFAGPLAILPHVTSLAGKATIPQIAALACRAQCVVGNDNGPVHITAIAGAPTFVVMSSVNDPSRILPQGPVVGYLKINDIRDLRPVDEFASLTYRDSLA